MKILSGRIAIMGQQQLGGDGSGSSLTLDTSALINITA